MRNTHLDLRLLPMIAALTACNMASDEAPLAVTACGESATSISEIQGRGATSPLEGEFVTLEGVVTAVVPAQHGFYLQDGGDGDPATSDGIFVYDKGDTVSVSEGMRVRLTAQVGEFYRNTQLSALSEWRQCGRMSLPAPTAVQLPLQTSNDLEALEGMLVSLQGLTVNDVYHLGRYGEVMLANGLRSVPTQVASPGEEAKAVAARNSVNKIYLDDGSTEQNPPQVVFPSPQLSAENTLRVGDTLKYAEGPLYFSFDEYRVVPTKTPQFAATNPRGEAPPTKPADSLRVASFNVLNFFNGNGEGGGFPTQRGAQNKAELERQRDKLVAAMAQINADIFAVMEIENDGFSSQSAIAQLTSALEQKSGESWTFASSKTRLGSDEITVGLLYRNDVVTANGAPFILNSANTTLDPQGRPLFDDQRNRPSLAQRFNLANGETVVVVVNHFKSKGSSCGEGDDDTAVGGQGNCNLTRTRAAQALVEWTRSDFSGERVIMLGDFNAYAKEDPISVIERGGYQGAERVMGAEQAYTYVFKGARGQLDYAFVNNKLADELIGYSEWHINADEPPALGYSARYKTVEQQRDWYRPDPYRSSDHDPVIVDLNIR
uniref:ExeM/NucH family extracellular endonuclease n=1 Tax=Thaumasiovibrio occultus TaxID=1891184 RepID=UPI00131C0683|nr:ExeM/NucH family extracellular endonuclease [Thaumasiovibrio occultus]